MYATRNAHLSVVAKLAAKKVVSACGYSRRSCEEYIGVLNA